MTSFEATQVWLAGFTSSKQAKSIGGELFHHLGFTAHHQVARLAIGRSLGLPDWPESAPDARGFSIKGHLLFGEEKTGALLWLALLVEAIHQHAPNESITLDALQAAVRDHWHRGIQLLQEDWDSCGSYEAFVEELITRRTALPEVGGTGAGTLTDVGTSAIALSAAGPVTVDLGVGRETDQPARWLLNGPGYSPNIAIMGQAGSGKTRMMLRLLGQLREQTGAPVMLIDAGKDELADKPGLSEEMGAEVLRVPASPLPIDMFHGSHRSDEDALGTAEAFRESLNKALQSGLTDNQRTRVLEALKPVLRTRERVTLPDLRAAIEAHYEAEGLREDRVTSMMTELCQRTLFTPTMGPDEFFSRSWLLTFGNAPEESRRLVLFLLFDALHRYLRALPEAPMDAGHHRAVRLIVAIDEARPLLAAKHDGLSQLVRLHRSKGLSVLLASQSPDDYEGQSDDYMEQIGLAICFKTNATSTRVLDNMFRTRRGLNFASLEPGVCLTVIEGAPQRVKAF